MSCRTVYLRPLTYMYLCIVYYLSFFHYYCLSGNRPALWSTRVVVSSVTCLVFLLPLIVCQTIISQMMSSKDLVSLLSLNTFSCKLSVWTAAVLRYSKNFVRARFATAVAQNPMHLLIVNHYDFCDNYACNKCELWMCDCITAVAVCSLATTYSNDHPKERNRSILATAA